ncbi:fanconi-associated nuclease 1-like [Uloborus diversus]|uniref:fanconi-associated nuclease 1-like n=1 Tax=Uloborus diversus TaxID=327109 RepID=UPI0024097BF4|nr:fanconi-associated nuclease 1-like [Uloborus diversus]
MKKATSLLDYFKVVNNVSCPACGKSVPKSSLNEHFDSTCTTSGDKPPDSASNSVENKIKPNNAFTVSSRLSRTKRKNVKRSTKAPRSKGQSSNSPRQRRESKATSDDVIILSEIRVSSENKNIKENHVSDCEVSNDDNNQVKSENDFSIKKSETLNISDDKNFEKPAVVEIVNKPVLETGDFTHKSPVDSKIKEKPSTEQNTSGKDSLGVSDISALLRDVENSVGAEDEVFSENSNKTKDASDPTENSSYSPYYISNFKHILNTVLSEEENSILFNAEDMGFVESFQSSSTPAQKLYVRLFQRKYKWLRQSKINYPEISKDLKMVLEELVNCHLLDSESDKIDLETAMDLLSLPEAKVLFKQYNFTSSGKNKNEIKEMLMKQCKEHKSVFFMNGKNSVSNIMLKKIKQIIGPCYRLALLPKRVFTRIFMLFSLPTISEDDDDAAGGQQQQLLTLLQVNKGELKFPAYKKNRKIPIFIDRDDLIRYEEARQLENDLLNAVESKNFELAKDLSLNAKEEFDEQCSSPFVERASSLPNFLKKYTSFHIYVRCMTGGVDVLQKLRQYDEAVSLLRKLLKQNIFCLDYHGRWYDRLALNLEQHLKKREEALEAIKQGLQDENVRVGHRYALLTRALRIVKNDDDDDEFKKQVTEDANVIEAPKVVIKGRLFPRPIYGRRNVFISSCSTPDNEDDITVLGVEQLAIEHYKGEGFSEGIHGEGTTFHAIYGLLFWDIIYDGDIPDVFISPYQNHPLDLNSDSFFKNREKQILSHLERLQSSTIEEIKEIIKATWEAHHGECSLVMWDRFTDVDHIQGLVGCLGNNIICGICERLARDFRFTRSGVPDLVVWNPKTLCVKIVEVKGPGDKLSTKQILWLDYLIKLGADAEVCLVEAVGSKKLRKE